VWEFIIDPRNMPRWVPYIDAVAGVDRPLQTGDRLTQWRRDFFRRETQELLVEEVIPYRSFHLRVLSPQGSRMKGTATVNVEEAADPGTTWIEEVIAYSLGDGRVARWADRWVLNPLFQVVVGRKSRRAFRRLADLLTQGPEGRTAAGGPGASGA
jgi:hypothetical protein